MELNQTYKLLHSKESHKQNEKPIDSPMNWEKIFANDCDQQGLNFQNIQSTHTIQ